MINEKIVIQVSGIRYSKTSYGALVDLQFDINGNCSSASRLIWFPICECSISEVEYKRDYFGKEITSKKYFIAAPKSFLDKNKIKYKNEK